MRSLPSAGGSMASGFGWCGAWRGLEQQSLLLVVVAQYAPHRADDCPGRQGRQVRVRAE